AYQLYLLGRYFWNKRTAADFEKAIEYFNQAIEKDPNYALAYAGLADAYVLLSAYGEGRPEDTFPKAKAAAIKALELDRTLGAAPPANETRPPRPHLGGSARPACHGALRLRPQFGRSEPRISTCDCVESELRDGPSVVRRMRLDPARQIRRSGR